MFGFKFFKSAPSHYVFLYRGRALVREGRGLSFTYWSPAATLVQVPVVTQDALFAVSEKTTDYQPVTLRGQVSFRVVEPRKTADAFDFTISAKGEYLTEDLNRLRERIVNGAQEAARNLLIRRNLREALRGVDVLTESMLAQLKADEGLRALGVEVEDLALVSVATTPELTRALEAHARELLQKESDVAIYDRRNHSIDREREVAENEFRTQLAVEQGKREIRERQIAADIALEQRRRELVDTQVENDRKMAESRAYGLETSLKPLREANWKMLLALSAGKIHPSTMMAMSFQEIAENAAKIGEVNFSPDLMAAIANGGGKK